MGRRGLEGALCLDQERAFLLDLLTRAPLDAPPRTPNKGTLEEKQRPFNHV